MVEMAEMVEMLEMLEMLEMVEMEELRGDLEDVWCLDDDESKLNDDDKL